MIFKKALMAAVAAATLIAAGTSGAMAADRDQDGRPDRSWAEHHDHHGNHDRYWRPGYHGYAGRDHIFVELRRHQYSRFSGDPHFYRGHYVVRSYNRFGHVVFVEINPYTGGFIGEIRL